MWEILLEWRGSNTRRENKIREQQPWFWTWQGRSSGSVGDALQLLEEDIAGAVWVLRAPEASAVRRMCGGAAPDHHGHLARVKLKLLASTYCVAGCAERGHTHLPSAEVEVFVDDITALLMEKNKVLAEMAKEVMQKLREEVEKKGIEQSVNENGKEGKSKMIASCGFLEDEVTMADSVESLGVDLRTRVKKLGAKEKARKKCNVRFSLIKKNKAFQKKYMQVGIKKLLRAGMAPVTWGQLPQKDEN